MHLDRYLHSLHDALTASARTAGPDVQEAAERLAQSMESALRLTLMEFAADFAAEVTLKLDGDTVDVRLRTDGPEVVVTSPDMGPPSPPEPPAPPPPPEDSEVSRISLRLPESLKNQVEQAATAEGLSINAWLVRAVRSEEHTSELQSRGHLVCRLLLEKKK